MISASSKLLLVIGSPIKHSLSPVIFNAAFEYLNMTSEYVYAAAEVQAINLADAIKGIKAFNIRGASVTLPHKQNVIQYVDWVDPMAAGIKAVNTIVNDAGILKAYNTDCLAAVNPIKDRINLKAKKVAVFGAGGAARAIIYGLVQAEADVLIYARNLDTAKKLADDFKIDVHLTSNLSQVKKMDVIVNTTPLGMYPEIETSILPRGYLSASQIVMDAVYRPQETKLLIDAKAQGATVISGVEMFIAQAAEQFKLYTGKDAPKAIMLQALKDYLNA